MGFKAPRTIYKLVFADPEFEGFVVRARSASTAEFLAITDLTGGAEDNGGAQMRTLLELFAKVLVSWNLEDEQTGQELAPDFDALLRQDFSFVMKIITAWTEAVADVSAPLGSGSTPGPPPTMVSIPMEVLSASLAS